MLTCFQPRRGWTSAWIAFATLTLWPQGTFAQTKVWDHNRNEEFIVRLSGEYGLARYGEDLYIRRRTEQSVADLRSYELVDGETWGGRVDVAYAFAGPKNHFAFLPRASFTYAFVEGNPGSDEAAGVQYEWVSDPRFWAAAIGFEMQFFHRMITLGSDTAVAAVVQADTPTGVSGTKMDGVSGGILSTIDLGLRVPLKSFVAIGARGSSGAFWSFHEERFRSTVALFVEWTRRMHDEY